jgi:hypothetical protein
MTLEQYLHDVANKSPREKATLDALIQIDQQFGKRAVDPYRKELLERHAMNVKAAKEAQKTRQKTVGTSGGHISAPVANGHWPLNTPRKAVSDLVDTVVTPPKRQYDLEILQEQVTEVGDQLSADFKRGIEAAVAVLLEGKHLEEFLS